MANIRSIEEYTRSVWDWGWLNDCFKPTPIRVSDVDGIVERNGHFLFFEGKGIRPDGERVVVGVGQRILQDALFSTGRASIITLWGKTNNNLHEQHRLIQGVTYCAIMGTPNPVYASIRWEAEFARTRSRATYEGPVTQGQVQRAVRGWFTWANSLPSTKQRAAS